MADCRIHLYYEELVIARLTVCGRPIVGSNGCETILLRLIDVRKKLVATRSSAGCFFCAPGDLSKGAISTKHSDVRITCQTGLETYTTITNPGVSSVW